MIIYGPLVNLAIALALQLRINKLHQCQKLRKVLRVTQHGHRHGFYLVRIQGESESREIEIASFLGRLDIQKTIEMRRLSIQNALCHVVEDLSYP